MPSALKSKLTLDKASDAELRIGLCKKPCQKEQRVVCIDETKIKKIKDRP